MNSLEEIFNQEGFKNRMALKSGIFYYLDSIESQNLKDGYYGITDNLREAIENLEEAVKAASSDKTGATPETVTALNRELAIYEKIGELLNESQLGVIL